MATAQRFLPVCLFTALATGASVSDAHFSLDSPPAARTQDALGSPQKMPPCGDEDGGTDTGIVTTYQSGQTITVTVNELIFHPGHYRIALAVDDRSELPEEPPVTPADTPCGSAPIQDPPEFPVLADGVFEHTEPFDGPQSIEITLPADVTCSHCTLQVIQFMSEHGLNVPGGCFYHHCADIALQTEPVEPTTGAGGADGSDASGDGCSAAGESRSSGAGVLLGMVALALRRRSVRGRASGRGGRSPTISRAT